MSAQPIRLARSEGRRAISRRLNFTEAALRNLPTPAERPTWVYDVRVGSLAFVVSPHGRKSFVFYRKHNGRPVKKRLGTLERMTVEQARQQVTKLNAAYNEGVDAVAESKRLTSSTTLGELWTRYERDHLRKHATPATIRGDSSIERVALARWRARPLASITSDACRELHRTLSAERGGRTANRALQLVQRLCNWARLPVPFDRRDVPWFKERSRERYLEASELARLAAAIEQDDDEDVGDFVTLALATGARRENLASMEWGELDLAAAVWRIPATKAKSKAAIVLPLVPTALAVLEARAAKLAGRGPFVFPSPLTDERHRTGGNIFRAFARVRAKAKLDDVRLHDLRRTLGSWMVAQGVSLPTIGKALGHNSSSATAIYARMSIDPVRQAMSAAADAIAKASSAKGATLKQ